MKDNSYVFTKSKGEFGYKALVPVQPIYEEISGTIIDSVMVIAILWIPDNAVIYKHRSSIDEKRRTDIVYVLDMVGLGLKDGKEVCFQVNSGRSKYSLDAHDSNVFTYNNNEWIYPKNGFSPSYKQCTYGIHYYSNWWDAYMFGRYNFVDNDYEKTRNLTWWYILANRLHDFFDVPEVVLKRRIKKALENKNAITYLTIPIVVRHPCIDRIVDVTNDSKLNEWPSNHV